MTESIAKMNKQSKPILFVKQFSCSDGWPFSLFDLRHNLDVSISNRETLRTFPSKLTVSIAMCQRGASSIGRIPSVAFVKHTG